MMGLKQNPKLKTENMPPTISAETLLLYLTCGFVAQAATDTVQRTDVQQFHMHHSSVSLVTFIVAELPTRSLQC